MQVKIIHCWADNEEEHVAKLFFFFIARGIKKLFREMKLLLSQINYSSAGKNYIENGLAVKLIMFWAKCLLLALQWCVRLWQWSCQSHTVLCIPSSKRGLLSLVPGYASTYIVEEGTMLVHCLCRSLQGTCVQEDGQHTTLWLFCFLNIELCRVFSHQSFLV